MGEYSFIWNVTGNPAGCMPVTTVQVDEQTFDDDFKDSWTNLLNSECQGSVGMPVSVQVIGYNYEDEKLLGIMKQIETQIGYKIKTKMDINVEEYPKFTL